MTTCAHFGMALEGKIVFAVLIGFLGLPAGFPSILALFWGLCFFGGVSVGRNLLVLADGAPKLVPSWLKARMGLPRTLPQIRLR